MFRDLEERQSVSASSLTMKKILTCLILVLHLDIAFGGGGATNALCISYLNLAKQSSLIPPCADQVVAQDLLECGFKNKYDTRGMSMEEIVGSDYCMFQMGYRYRDSPKKKSFCEIYSTELGCPATIERYKIINDEDHSAH